MDAVRISDEGELDRNQRSDIGFAIFFFYFSRECYVKPRNSLLTANTVYRTLHTPRVYST